MSGPSKMAHIPGPVMVSVLTEDNTSKTFILSESPDVHRYRDSMSKARSQVRRESVEAGAGSRFAWGPRPPLGEGTRGKWGPGPGLQAQKAASGASPPCPGLCSSSPSSLRAQVRPPGKGPRDLTHPWCLCPQGDLGSSRKLTTVCFSSLQGPGPSLP